MGDRYLSKTSTGKIVSKRKGKRRRVVVHRRDVVSRAALGSAIGGGIGGGLGTLTGLALGRGLSGAGVGYAIGASVGTGAGVMFNELFPSLAEFAKEKGWRCGGGFISWRSKCYRDPVSGEKRFTKVVSPKTGRTRKEPVGLTYKEYQKERSQAVRKRGRGEALSDREQKHLGDVEKLALKTGRGKRRQIEARAKRTESKADRLLPTKETTTANSSKPQKADTWSSIDPKEKKNYSEVLIDYKPQNHFFEINIFGDKSSDPTKSKGSYVVTNSGLDFEDGFKDFAFEKPSPQEVRKKKEFFADMGWRGRTFHDDSPRKSIVNGFPVSAYIPKDKIEQWKKQTSLKVTGGEDKDRIIPPQESRATERSQGSNERPRATNQGDLFAASKAQTFPIAEFGGGGFCTCAPPLKRRRRPLKRRRSRWDYR